MLDNFKEMYNKELERFYGHIGGLSYLILGSEEVRSFVYEICKNCITSQPSVEAGRADVCKHEKVIVIAHGWMCEKCRVVLELPAP